MGYTCQTGAVVVIRIVVQKITKPCSKLNGRPISTGMDGHLDIRSIY